MQFLWPRTVVTGRQGLCARNSEATDPSRPSGLFFCFSGPESGRDLGVDGSYSLERDAGASDHATLFDLISQRLSVRETFALPRGTLARPASSSSSSAREIPCTCHRTQSTCPPRCNMTGVSSYFYHIIFRRPVHRVFSRHPCRLRPETRAYIYGARSMEYVRILSIAPATKYVHRLMRLLSAKQPWSDQPVIECPEGAQTDRPADRSIDRSDRASQHEVRSSCPSLTSINRPFTKVSTFPTSTRPED